jgi:Uri superfamily endonuclease
MMGFFCDEHKKERMNDTEMLRRQVLHLEKRIQVLEVVINCVLGECDVERRILEETEHVKKFGAETGVICCSRIESIVSAIRALDDAKMDEYIQSTEEEKE